MPKITLDGKEIEVPAGQTLLLAAKDRGIEIPFFCWHPGLSIAANCRMCLVKATVQGRASFVPSCHAQAVDGMVVDTCSAEVLAARKSVLEYLLINHPLDCPQCDCAGECMLQDHAFEHGHDRSRFVEPKVTKTTTTFGPLVHYWGSRCIVCTRCVRFTDEITGTGELAEINRGDHKEIAVFPGRPLDNPMSGCVVDLCPVGALINADFMFQSRVWYMKSTPSVCPSCSRGCNIEVDALADTVKRFMPRHNAEVNSHWMCDAGRASYKSLNSPDRLANFRIREKDGRWTETTREAAVDVFVRKASETRKAHGTDAIAGLGSLWQTNEEVFLFENLIQSALGSGRLGFLEQAAGFTWTSKSGFVIDADKNPNRRGAQWLVDEARVAGGLEQVLTELEAGRIRFLYVSSGMPDFKPSDRLLHAMEKAEFVVVQDILGGPLVEKAHLVLPGAAFSEKDGTFVNSQGRVQRIRRATAGPLDAATDVEILQRILAALGVWSDVFSAEAIFREIAKEVGAFAGMTYAGLGEMGQVAVPAGAGAEARK